MKEEIKKLLQETGRAHHQAFIKTNGEHYEWPMWYAKYLLDHSQFLKDKYSEKELEGILEGFRNDDKTDWIEKYAEALV